MTEFLRFVSDHPLWCFLIALVIGGTIIQVLGGRAENARLRMENQYLREILKGKVEGL